MDFLHQFGVSTVTFILVVSILVFIHEFGHYWVALKNGVKVETFSIGFGPELFHRFDKRGTRWRVALIPLGGYVKMFGDLDPASVSNAAEAGASLSAEERQVAFFAKTVWQRMAIVFAGPAVNFLFCIVALFGLYVTIGQPSTPAVINGFVSNSPAEQAGMQIGDKIIRLGEQEIKRFQEVQKAMSYNLDHPIEVTLLRDGEEKTFNITPVIEEVTNNFGVSHRVGRLGIKSGGITEFKPMTLGESAIESVVETKNITVNTLVGLWQIIIGERSSKEMGGAITIAKLSGDMVIENEETKSIDFGKTVASLIWFMAILSANLGLINLFPIPVLDGGHLVFYTIEAIRGKPLGEVAQEYSLRFGLALVLTLTVFALWNDLTNFGVIGKIVSLFS